MIDIVIPLGNKCGWGDYQELKYALRSAEKYVPHLGNAYVIGAKPGWLLPEFHLDLPDPYTHNKDANLIQKVVYAASQPGITHKFIRMSDDQLFLAPFEEVRWYLEELDPNSFNRSPKKWYNRLENTYKRICNTVDKVYNFDSHVPMVYYREAFIKIAMSHDYGADPGMCINTMYANYVGGTKQKLPEGARLGVSGPTSKEDLEKKAEKAILCNYVDRGLTSVFKEWVMEQFPQASRFEE